MDQLPNRDCSEADQRWEIPSRSAVGNPPNWPWRFDDTRGYIMKMISNELKGWCQTVYTSVLGRLYDIYTWSQVDILLLSIYHHIPSHSELQPHLWPILPIPSAEATLRLP
jgi:hypothetical protein